MRMIWLYGLTFLGVLSSLQLVSFSGATTTKLRSTMTGGVGGGLGFNYFSNWTQTGSFLTLLSEGGAGNIGYFYLAGIVALCVVWAWNLFSSRRYLIR